MDIHEDIRLSNEEPKMFLDELASEGESRLCDRLGTVALVLCLTSVLLTAGPTSVYAEPTLQRDSWYFGFGLSGHFTAAMGDKHFLGVGDEYGYAGGLDLNFLIDILDWVQIDFFARISSGVTNLKSWRDPTVLRNMQEAADGGASDDLHLGGRVRGFVYDYKDIRPFVSLGVSHNRVGVLSRTRSDAPSGWACYGAGCPTKRDILALRGVGLEMGAGLRYDLRFKNLAGNKQKADLLTFYLQWAYTLVFWDSFKQGVANKNDGFSLGNPSNLNLDLISLSLCIAYLF